MTESVFLSSYIARVAHINSLEANIAALSDEELAAKINRFSSAFLLAARPWIELLPEAFAVVREASKRTLNMRHFDVQLVGRCMLAYARCSHSITVLSDQEQHCLAPLSTHVRGPSDPRSNQCAASGCAHPCCNCRLGGMALHEGNITEMATGEGKTLAATLPAYLNALSGKGVHIVTVNDYLAKRDSEW